MSLESFISLFSSMPSTSKTSSASSSAFHGVEGKAGRNNGSSPYEESANEPSVKYDPPPASWFFSRGTKDTSKQSKKTNSENKLPEPPSERKISSSSETQGRNNNVHFPSNVDAGMVSDNEGDDDDEHEGFNFIAVSNSLLMAGRSFEHLPESSEHTDELSRSSSDKHQGVLIVDGVSDGSDAAGNHNQDASVLTIPGSDSLPSDIGTICHHDDVDDEDDPLFGQGGVLAANGTLEQGNQDRRDVLEDPYSENQEPLVHRFLKNLQRAHRLRKVSDASDIHADVSVVRNEDDEISMTTVETQVDRFRRGVLKVLYGERPLPIALIGFAMAMAFLGYFSAVSERKYREALELRLLKQEEANLNMRLKNMDLNLEIESLVEEAAVAAARAESLAKEQERLILEREATDKAEKQRVRLLQEQEQRKQQERKNQKRRRQQPWRSDDESFGWFFDDDNEECSSNNEGGSTTYTIADNCWIKAKADIDLGNCGGETRDRISSFWAGLWEDWDYYYFDERTRSDAVESFPNGENDQNGNDLNELDNGYYQIGSGEDEQEGEGAFEYQDDTYYPPQDPLQDLFSVIHAAGESFVSKLSNLMSDEVESTQKAAREMEETAWRKYEQASDTVVSAMEIAKEDMRELSKEALLSLRTVIQKSNASPDEERGAKPSAETQSVTRKGLNDAAIAVASLSKSWQEYAKSLSVAGEGAEQ